MKNIFYFRKISRIVGTEQFLYEIAKRYKDRDITVYYDEADGEQLKRLKEFVRCKKHKKGEKVICDRAFFNFNLNMIEDVESTENYYAFISHANYEELGYEPPINHPKINHYIGVSKFAARKLEEYGRILGMDIKVETMYDPLMLEPKEDVKVLVSACRLDDEVKGGKRTVRLIEALDRYCEEHGTHYVWMIFTNHTTLELPSKNCVYMQPRIDVRPYIQMADWVLQLSNDMETFCYTINEGWGYGVPCVTTPLSILKELPFDENEHITLEYDCSNVDEVARLIFEKEVKPFKYTPPEPKWEKVLAKGKSTYKKGEEKKVKVRCTYFLGASIGNHHIGENEVVEIEEDRVDELVSSGYFELLP